MLPDSDVSIALHCSEVCIILLCLSPEEVGNDDVLDHVLDHVTRLIGTVSMERMYMKPKLRKYPVFHRMVSTCRKNR